MEQKELTISRKWQKLAELCWYKTNLLKKKKINQTPIF